MTATSVNRLGMVSAGWYAFAVMNGGVAITDDIVAAACGGSKPDQDRIMAALGSQVRAAVLVRLAPSTDIHAVEDIAQQALMALLRGLSRLEIRTAGGLRGFLSRIVANKVADHLRDRIRGTGRPAKAGSLDSTVGHYPDAGPLWEFLSATGTSPSGAAQRAELIDQVLRELATIKPEYREVITLAFFDQLATAEIAERMGISRPAAAMLLSRAVKTLRRNITGSSRFTGDPESGQ